MSLQGNLIFSPRTFRALCHMDIGLRVSGFREAVVNYLSVLCVLDQAFHDEFWPDLQISGSA